METWCILVCIKNMNVVVTSSNTQRDYTYQLKCRKYIIKSTIQFVKISLLFLWL